MDTSPFIDHLETHPLYGPVAATLFAWLERRGSSGVTSTITMTELQRFGRGRIRQPSIRAVEDLLPQADV